MQNFLKNMSKDKILLLLAAGILLFLLSFPLEKLSVAGTVSKSQQQTAGADNTENAGDSGDFCSGYQQQLEQQLETLLENVQGAGQVRVMVILEDSGEKIVEKDIQTESSSTRNETDNITEENSSSQESTVLENGQTPWITREILPQVSGIAVVAEGGGSAVVKSEISSMLEALFGLPAHKIKVLEGDF